MNHRSLPWTLGLAAGAALLTGPLASEARADTVLLKNGHELYGRLVEERKDEIVLRTPERGTMPIKKADIASFLEDDTWQKAYDFTAPAAPTESPERPPADAERPPADGAGSAGGEDPLAGPWEWPAGLSDEQIAQLEAKRKQIMGELEELGPTPEERLAAVEPESPEQAAEIREAVAFLDYHRRRGSANMVRRFRRDRLVEQFGNRAIPQLAEALSSEGFWGRRMSAQALGILAARSGDEGKQAKWLIYHFDAPGKIIALYSRGPGGAEIEEEDATGAATSDLDEALANISGQEAEGPSAWRQWWTREKARWTQEENARERNRTELLAKLQQLRQGIDPDQEG